MKKSITINIEDLKNETVSINVKSEGLSTIELIGILEIAKRDVLADSKNKVKKEADLLNENR
jgi:hypothetical protein